MSIEEREDGLGQLGALPEDRQEPRQMSPEEAGAMREGQGVPVDIQRQEGVQSIPVQPDRLMSQGADVRSVYDARPINAKDFIDTQNATISVPFSAPGTIVQEFDYFIPGGYIGVLRGFRYEIETPVGQADRDTFRVSILVNDIIQLGYENLKLGQEQDRYVPTFILAPLNGKLTLRLTFNGQDVADSGITDLPVYSELYGNLLLSQGVPLPFEIGNIGRIRPLGGT